MFRWWKIYTTGCEAILGQLLRDSSNTRNPETVQRDKKIRRDEARKNICEEKFLRVEIYIYRRDREIFSTISKAVLNFLERLGILRCNFSKSDNDSVGQGGIG